MALNWHAQKGPQRSDPRRDLRGGFRQSADSPFSRQGGSTGRSQFDTLPSHGAVGEGSNADGFRMQKQPRLPMIPGSQPMNPDVLGPQMPTRSSGTQTRKRRK